MPGRTGRSGSNGSCLPWQSRVYNTTSSQWRSGVKRAVPVISMDGPGTANVTAIVTGTTVITVLRRDWVVVSGADIRNKALFRRLELTYLLSYPRESVTSPCASACAFTTTLRALPSLPMGFKSGSHTTWNALIVASSSLPRCHTVSPGW